VGSSESFQFDVGERGTTTALVYRAKDPIEATLVLAHGAGAAQTHPFLVGMAERIAARGVDVVTFNFLYTEQQRRIPDRGPALEACYAGAVEAVLDRVPAARRSLFIGGKSMGGRIATQIAAANPDLPVAGLVLLGYPLHPPGRPEQRRDAHLPSIRRPVLFVQGSRDTFGMPPELESALTRMKPTPSLHVVKGGDHSFKIAQRNAEWQAAIYDDIQRAIVAWMHAVIRT